MGKQAYGGIQHVHALTLTINPFDLQVGFDFTTDGFQTTWQNITLAQRLPAMASIAVANIKSMLPPPPPFSNPSPPRPPRPPPIMKPPPSPLGGRVPAVVMLTDPTPLPDADLKQKLQVRAACEARRVRGMGTRTGVMPDCVDA